MAALPPHFCMPDTLPGDILDAGLGPEAVGLIASLWAESNRYQLDGRLHVSRAKAQRGWTEEIARGLVIMGAIKSTDDHIDFADHFLTVNRSREQIRLLRDARAAGGKKGGATRASETAARLPDGTFGTATCPLHGTPWQLGKYGPKCTSKARIGEPANHRGYCVQTPSSRLQSGPKSGPVSEATSVANSTEASTANAASPLGFVSGWDCIQCHRRVDILANNHTVTDLRTGQTARLHGDCFLDALDAGRLDDLATADFDQYGDPMREPS